MHRCPRCDSTLTRQTRFDIEMAVCPKGCGTEVPMSRLIPLLQAVGKELFSGLDAETEIEGIADPGAGAKCPGCRKEMAHFGYMGTRLVHLDRCSRCSKLWINTDALAVMAALSVRTSQRKSNRHRLTEEHMIGMDRRFRAIMAARMVERALL